MSAPDIAHPATVPFQWADDALTRLERWTDPEREMDDATRVATLRAILFNLRYELTREAF